MSEERGKIITNGFSLYVCLGVEEVVMDLGGDDEPPPYQNRMGNHLRSPSYICIKEQRDADGRREG